MGLPFFEGIHRKLKDSNYNAAVGGFEYTIPGIAGSSKDLGLLAEYHYDSRGKLATTPFQKDLFAGARLAFNDADSTEMLDVHLQIGLFERELSPTCHVSRSGILLTNLF